MFRLQRVIAIVRHIEQLLQTAVADEISKSLTGMKTKYFFIVAFAIGAFPCDNTCIVRGNSGEIIPEPIESVTLGQKIDYLGKNFHIFYEDDSIRYAYLDLIRGQYIEGSVNIRGEYDDTLSLIRSRERRVDSGSRRRANSFLVFQNSAGKDEILVYTVGDFFYWSNRNREWRNLDPLGRNLNVQPVIHQVEAIDGFFFFRTSPIGQEGIKYYKMDFQDENLVEFSQDAHTWAVIGEWNGKSVLGKFKRIRPDSENTQIVWSFYHFDADKGVVNEPLMPKVLFRDRVYHARIVNSSGFPTLIFGDRRSGGRGGLTVARLVEGRWVGTQIETLEHYGPEELALNTSGINDPDFGNFEVQESARKIYVNYILDGRVYLQIWDHAMEEFTEYWLGQFGEGSGRSVKMKVLGPDRLLTLSKDNRRMMEVVARDSEGLNEIIDGDYIVDLILREWRISDLSVVRTGRIEDLPVLDTITTKGAIP